ncbi:Release factor glutamine methyltransferase [candidate division SR1 bacterium Aalborg_AAW-1]|nr:Release factor glutamine methyltransferase [candidate division SR1 bacterium Aalborg_AAW-1]
MTFFQLIGDPHYKHKFVLQKIIGHLTGWTREELIVHYDDEVSVELGDQINGKYRLYSEDHEPLEYILGYVEYGGLRFSVNKNTIIPRPETEYMIEAVREYLQGKMKNEEGKIILVDVGTGSGVLGLSLLHSHGSQIEQAFLIDISEDALAVAKKNYNYCIVHNQIDKSVDVMIEKGNLFSSPALDSGLLRTSQGQEVIILANLPYIPDETFDTNPDLSIKYEPRVAFVGGDDGLELYRIMFAQIRESGYQTTMFLEMMTWQVDILRQEFDWLVFEEIKTFHFQIKIVKVMFKN